MISGAPPRMVWIVGHSYVHWAAKRADVRPHGKNLGFSSAAAQIHWMGIRGLRWAQLYRECCLLSRRVSGNIVLVVHAGGNDLGSIRSVDLMESMKQDLARCFSIFDGLSLVWSDIVSRPRWDVYAAPRAIDRARRRVNREVSGFVRQLGVFSVRHTELEGDNRNLIRGDGVHLTDIGLDIFLTGLMAGIEEALSAVGRRGSH